MSILRHRLLQTLPIDFEFRACVTANDFEQSNLVVAPAEIRLAHVRRQLRVIASYRYNVYSFYESLHLEPY